MPNETTRAGAREAKRAEAREAQLRQLVREPGLTVLTGGQTGVDTYAAVAALAAGLSVHLVFPRGLRQEDGRLTAERRRQLGEAVMHELGPATIRYRTWTCVYLADVVLLLDPAGGAGCRETARAARTIGRPLLEPTGLDRPIAAAVEAWLERANAQVLMVAGCRGSLLARRPSTVPFVQTSLAEIMTGARAWHDRLVSGPA